jgi:hypothetical protein
MNIGALGLTHEALLSLDRIGGVDRLEAGYLLCASRSRLALPMLDCVCKYP